MSGEDDAFINLRNKLAKKFDDTTSEWLGYLGNQATQAKQQQLSDNAKTTATETYQSKFNGKEAIGDVITPKREGKYVPPKEKDSEELGNTGRYNAVPKLVSQNLHPVISTVENQRKLKVFRTQLLLEHNRSRSQHGARDLVLSNKLNECAQIWAEYLAQKDELDKNASTSYGESIFRCFSPNPNYYPSAKKVCKNFYNQVVNYKFDGDPTGDAPVNHFTQMIWCGSTEIGVGIAKAVSGFYYVVVNYNPRGNYSGEYKKNVLPMSSNVLQKPKSEVIDEQQTFKISAEGAKFERFMKLTLNQHNIYRGKHGVPSLKLSTNLIQSAQEWADQCATEGEILSHYKVPPFGESVIRLPFYETNYYPDAEELCRTYYNEVVQYKYGGDPEKDNVRNFTQMVWKATTEIGIGIAKSEYDEYFVVFQYNPRGNIKGQYQFNIFRPRSVFIPQPKLSTRPTTVSIVEQPTVVELDAVTAYKMKVEQFRNMVLAIHNINRMRHAAPPLKFSKELDIYAQESADLLAVDNYCHHRLNCKYGENCSRYEYDDPDAFPSAETVCHDYYKEINAYRWIGTPLESEKVFHFTQMVWCDSVQIGIGFTKSKIKKNEYYIVINYNRKGSIPGLFEDNVYPLGTKVRPPKRISFIAPKVIRLLEVPKGKVDINKFRKLLRNQHNIYRKRHGAKFVKSSDILNEQAQEWANKCAEDDVVDYRQDKYGENIYAAIRSDPKWYPTAEQVGKHFYAEHTKYKFEPTPDPGTEQFTQMVWNATTEIGIGVAKAESGRVYVVVNYSPRGNLADKYAQNVFRTGCSAQ